MRSASIIAALAASMLFPLAAAMAQVEGPSQRTLGTTSDGKRIISMVVYGTEACPEGKEGEIVVCARQPEEERYRLPKQFRKAEGEGASGTPGYVDAIDTGGASAAGSCSVVGAGGATGCNRQMMRSARKERQQQRAEERAVAEDVAAQ